MNDGKELNALLKRKLYALSTKEEKLYFDLQDINSNELESDFATESLSVMQDILSGITSDDASTLEEKLRRIRSLKKIIKQAKLQDKEETVLLNTAEKIEIAIENDLDNKESILNSVSGMMADFSDRVQGATAMMFANDPLINLATKGATAGASFVARKVRDRVEKNKQQKSALKRDITSLLDKSARGPQPSNIPPGAGPIPDPLTDEPKTNNPFENFPEEGPFGETGKIVDILGTIAVDVKTILSLMMQKGDKLEDESLQDIEDDRERLKRTYPTEPETKNNTLPSQSKIGGFLSGVLGDTLKYFGIAAGAGALGAAITTAIGAVAWPAVFAAAGLTAAYLWLQSDTAKNLFDKTSGAITGTGVVDVPGLGLVPKGPEKRGLGEDIISRTMPLLPESELLANVGLRDGIKASNDIADIQGKLRRKKRAFDDLTSRGKKDSEKVMDGKTFSGMGTFDIGKPLWVRELEMGAIERVALPLAQEKYRREIETFSGKREWSEATNEEAKANAVFVAKEHRKNLDIVLSKLKEQTEKQDELFKKSGMPYWAFAQQNPGFEEARLEQERTEKEIKYIDNMIQGLEDPKKSLEDLNKIIKSLNEELEKFEEQFNLDDSMPTVPSLRTRAFRTPIPQVKPGEMSNLDGIISEASRQYNVPESLIRGMIKQESAGNPNAVSSAGAGGLMQLMPGTAKQLGVTNRFDPYQNVMGGTKYMRQMLDMYGQNVPLALAAYNAGPYNKAVMRGVIPRNGETPEYVRRVSAFEKQFRAMPNNKVDTFNTKANQQAQTTSNGSPVVVNNFNQANVTGGTTQAPQQSGNGGASQPDGRGTSVMASIQ